MFATPYRYDVVPQDNIFATTPGLEQRARPSASSSGIELHNGSKPFVETVANALGMKMIRVVETSGTDYMRERTQWDSGANLVCVSPGVVFAYDRNTYAQHRAAQGGHRGNQH